jgi:hypothetical protein
MTRMKSGDQNMDEWKVILNKITDAGYDERNEIRESVLFNLSTDEQRYRVMEELEHLFSMSDWIKSIPCN